MARIEVRNSEYQTLAGQAVESGTESQPGRGAQWSHKVETRFRPKDPQDLGYRVKPQAWLMELKPPTTACMVTLEMRVLDPSLPLRRRMPSGTEKELLIPCYKLERTPFPRLSR